MNMKNVLVIPWAYEELNLVQFFKEYMLACLYMLIRLVILACQVISAGGEDSPLRQKRFTMSPSLRY